MDDLRKLSKKYQKDQLEQKRLLSDFKAIKSIHIDKLPHADKTMLSLYAHSFFCLFYGYDIKKFAQGTKFKITMFRKAYKEMKSAWVPDNFKAKKYDLVVGLFTIEDPERFLNKNM